MYAGRPVEIGTVEDIYYEPRMPYTLGLLGSLPRLDSTGQERLTPIHGSPPSLVNMPPGCPFAPRCPLHVAECDVEEPPLFEVGTVHRAACIRHEELATVHGDATEIFEETSIDAELAEELAIPADLATAPEGAGDVEVSGPPAGSQTEPRADSSDETGSVVSPKGDRP
jgi:peptide/nickel transport system ATP-binding protein